MDAFSLYYRRPMSGRSVKLVTTPMRIARMLVVLALSGCGASEQRFEGLYAKGF